jgi:rhodanese-related sulfurtransferase
MAAALAVAGLAGLASPARAETEPFGRLEIGQVEALLGQKGVVIFDVNSAQDYARAHVPGAIWSSMEDIEKKLPADRSLKLIYYCHSTT